MSLAPKIDEVRDVIYRGNYDFVSFVETWLQGHIHDNVVDIQGYNLIRRDRCERQHGGVCIYIKDSIEFSVLDELFDSLFEVLWINMRPTRLPRGFTNLIVGTVYHPPSAENAAMLNYLSNCLSVMESRFPNCGFIILGDFNKLNTSRLRTGYDLKQLVNFPTRGNNTLDIVLTNLNAFFDQPTKCSPFGLSDHMSIEVRPVERGNIQEKSKLTVKTRDLRPSSRLAMRKYLELVDIPEMLSRVNSCDEKASLQETIVKTGLDYVLPLRRKKIKSNDPPWINPTLKSLIINRQKALNQGNLEEFKRLRNQVNRQREICRAKYYKTTVQHLKQCKSNAWWNEVKKLSGMKVVEENSDKIVKALRPNDSSSCAVKKVLANEINNTFLSPMSIFAPLSLDLHRRSCTESVLTDTVLTVSSDVVFEKLSKLNPKKAVGPDGIPPWLLKENADLLAGSVTDILNCSYRECCLPLHGRRRT